jgi:hypothetical protein
MAHWHDDSAAAADGIATLSAMVPHPYGTLSIASVSANHPRSVNWPSSKAIPTLRMTEKPPSAIGGRPC